MSKKEKLVRWALYIVGGAVFMTVMNHFYTLHYRFDRPSFIYACMCCLVCDVMYFTIFRK